MGLVDVRMGSIYQEQSALTVTLLVSLARDLDCQHASAARSHQGGICLVVDVLFATLSVRPVLVETLTSV